VDGFFGANPLILLAETHSIINIPIRMMPPIHDFHVRGESLTNLMISSGYELQVVTDGSSKALFAEVSAKLADSRL
jgi:hypothetical protein